MLGDVSSPIISVLLRRREPSHLITTRRPLLLRPSGQQHLKFGKDTFSYSVIMFKSKLTQLRSVAFTLKTAGHICSCLGGVTALRAELDFSCFLRLFDYMHTYTCSWSHIFTR